MSVQKNGKYIIKGTINKKTGIWEVHLGTQKSETVVNIFMLQTSTPEPAQYQNAALFSPTIARLIKEIKQGSLKTWLKLT